MSFDRKGSGVIQWGSAVKAAIYNGKIVVLDEISNSFVFFDEVQSNSILSVLGKRFSELSEEESSSVNDLISHGLICIAGKTTAKNFQDIITSKGAFECDWALGDSKTSLSSFRPRYFMRAIILLLLAKRCSNKGKLHGLFQTLRSSPFDDMVADDKELTVIVSNVNLAILFLWRKTKCLEFAYTVARIAFIHKIKCRFVVGVQTHPFISHAWVEGENGVVFDRKELPEELAKIVSISGINECSIENF
ncbi:lasso peptide biosynthesis B2 protein [Pseudomonas sp. Q11]|uniref:lasso peptide biosynthesis B2 protein n=1 Tax=Pseudomonas sp. Q11 TaxID=2968470 RepID=UPI00210A6A6D|nr:lasso peptide biosynthesis B2 protein [Pseudomonas sp. Q11]MCQ6260221.1 lasso peptide biosynthesis B2 protein [Pseudomonas sp. Q11]